MLLWYKQMNKSVRKRQSERNKDIPQHRNCDFTLKIFNLQILYNYNAFFETHMPL